MRRTIVGFHPDELGDWVAELDCLHGQHVRHDPPLWPRPWVLTTAERDAKVGTALDCPLCDRAELPEGLRRARTAGPFDAETLPAGLRRTHLVAARTWGLLRVRAGHARLLLEVTPPVEADLAAGDVHAIPPEVAHRVTLDDDAVVEIAFLTR